MTTTLNIVPLAFDRATKKLLGSFTDDERKKYFGQPTSIDDIWDLVENLQDQQASRGSLQNMARIEPFINGMTQYSKVIEVFIQVKPEIMALIWGPLKLLLQLASQFTESFEKLLDAIGRIGENLPRFRRFCTAFPYNDQIQEVISILYEDIIDFYISTWKFFNRRAWNIMFSLVWASFETRFGLILRNLQRHQALIDNEARAEDIIQSQKAREEELKRAEERQLDDIHRKLKEIFDWLKPVDIEDRREKCGRLKQDGTGNWLIESKDIQGWITGKGKQSVWLTGKPGSGKTILSYTLLEYLELKVIPSLSGLVIYYFCSYEQTDLKICQNILCTLIYQIVLQKKDLLAYIYPEITKLLSVSMLQRLLYGLVEASVSTSEFVYVVIDGLDELPQTEREILLRILRGLKQKPLSLASRIFVASRDLADIRAVFEKQKPPALEISIKENNKYDIGRYIFFESWRVVEEFGFEGAQRLSVQKEIENSLSRRADGMFLWVHLVIESLLSQDSIKEIREALNDLPAGLGQVYERIIDRIKCLDARQRSKAEKTLGWMTCTYRPLKIEELEDALSMELHDFTLDEEKRQNIIRLRRLCGPIIELVKGVVTFVHFTAKEYLLSQRSGPFVDRISSHLSISLVCITYQCFRCFELGISNDEVIGFLLNGDLRLFDYVHSNWFEHIREFCKLNPNQKQIEVVSTALKILFWKQPTYRNLYHASVGSDLASNSTSNGISKIKEFSRFESELKIRLTGILEFQERLEKQTLKLGPGDELSRWCNEIGNNPLAFARGARRLQDVLEELLNKQPSDPLEIQAVRKAYGENLYFCRYRFCQSSSRNGFLTDNERRLHEERLHIKPHRCPVESCSFAGARPFASKALLRNHISRYHTATAEKASVVDIEILSELFQRMKYGDRNPQARGKLYENSLMGSTTSPQVDRVSERSQGIDHPFDKDLELDKRRLISPFGKQRDWDGRRAEDEDENEQAREWAWLTMPLPL